MPSPNLETQVTSTINLASAPTDSTPDPFLSPQSSEPSDISVYPPSHQSPACHPILSFKPISDLQITIPLAPDNSHFAQVPLHVYHCRPRVTSEQSSIDNEVLSCSARSRKLPIRLTDNHLNAAEVGLNIPLPESVHAALQHPGWQTAMLDELSSIHKNNTWDLVSLPPRRKAISTKWIYHVKTNADGSTTKLKARLVAKGFQQQAGTNYAETFAPLVKWNTLRSVVALAGHNG